MEIATVIKTGYMGSIPMISTDLFSSGMGSSALFKAWLAQSVERKPFKLVVVGSSPTPGIVMLNSFILFSLGG